MMDPRAYGLGAGSAGSDFMTWFKKRTVAIDLASVATIVAAEQDITVAGVGADEVVLAFYPAEALGVAVGVNYARVKAANTITVCVTNPTAGALDAGSKNFTLITGKIGQL